MRKRRRDLPVLMLCLFSIAAYGQQNWQGNAAVARSGEFDAPGLFAASNAFAENTKILVQNAQTGQRVQVTVTRRVPGAASVFLLLSEEAGKQIGLSGSQVIRVQASVVSTLGTDISDSLNEEVFSTLVTYIRDSLNEEAYSSDPDLNPPLSVAEQQLPAGGEEPAIAAQEPPAAEAEQPAGVAEAEEQPPAEVGAEVAAAAEPEVAEAAEEAAAEPPAAVEPTPEEKRLQELNDRIPQKQLYMPPRQQEVYALAPEPPAEEVEEEIAASEQSAEVEEETQAVTEPEVAEAEQVPEEPIEIEEEGPPEVSMPGPEAVEQPLEIALPGPEAAEPEKPSPEGTRLPAPEEQPPLTMAPEEPPTSEIAEAAGAQEVGEQPAEEVAEAEEEEEAVPEVAMAQAGEEEPIALSESLPSRSYFVQLGAYSTRNLAEKLAGNLTQSYSVTILPASSGGRRFYKVLVGPLNVDESGTLLYQFRARGFKDAFIQYVE